MEMMKKVGRPSNAEKWLRDAMANKDLVMGFGHRVYKQGDSRVPTMKACLEDLTEWSGDTKWLEIYNTMADIMVSEKGSIQTWISHQGLPTTSWVFLSICIHLFLSWPGQPVGRRTTSSKTRITA